MRNTPGGQNQPPHRLRSQPRGDARGGVSPCPPPLLLVLPSPGPVPSLPAGAEEAVELLCILMSREQGQREVF